MSELPKVLSKCELCNTVLTFEIPGGQVLEFMAHDKEYCLASMTIVEVQHNWMFAKLLNKARVMGETAVKALSYYADGGSGQIKARNALRQMKDHEEFEEELNKKEATIEKLTKALQRIRRFKRRSLFGRHDKTIKYYNQTQDIAQETLKECGLEEPI